MKNETCILGEIKKGTILVCTRTQSTGCGIKYVKEGSLVECAMDTPDYHDTIRVYRNYREKDQNAWKPVSRGKLRSATTEEEELYKQGTYFLNPVIS